MTLGVQSPGKFGRDWKQNSAHAKSATIHVYLDMLNLNCPCSILGELGSLSYDATEVVQDE